MRWWADILSFYFCVKYCSSLTFGNNCSYIYSQYHNTTDKKLKITAFLQAIQFDRWVAKFYNQVAPFFKTYCHYNVTSHSHVLMLQRQYIQ